MSRDPAAVGENARDSYQEQPVGERRPGLLHVERAGQRSDLFEFSEKRLHAEEFRSVSGRRSARLDAADAQLVSPSGRREVAGARPRHFDDDLNSCGPRGRPRSGPTRSLVASERVWFSRKIPAKSVESG